MLKVTATIQLTGGNHAHVEADSPEELHRALTYFAHIGVLPGTAQQQPQAVQADPQEQQDSAPAPVQDAADPQEQKDSEPAPQPEKPKRTRKPKEDKADAAPKDEPAKEDKPAQGELVKTTIEDAAAAITEVGNKLGLVFARNLLGMFGVKRAGELKPEQYAEFVAQCREMLKAEEDKADEEDPDNLL